MIVFYRACFWTSLLVFIGLSVWALFSNNIELITDIALPMAVGIFSFGQLWQQENQHLFDKVRYKKEIDEDFRKEFLSLLNDLAEAIHAKDAEGILSFNLGHNEKAMKFFLECVNCIRQLQLCAEKSFLMFPYKEKELASLFETLQKDYDNINKDIVKCYKNGASEKDKIELDKEINENASNSSRHTQELVAFLRALMKEVRSNA